MDILIKGSINPIPNSPRYTLGSLSRVVLIYLDDKIKNIAIIISIDKDIIKDAAISFLVFLLLYIYIF